MTSAVLLHPHPDRGGDQHNHVITALHERLAAAGVTPHRFDFASADLNVAGAQAVAAVEAAAEPVYLVGYSFGGAVAATVDHPRVTGWSLIAPALTLIDPNIGADARPKQVIAAEADAWFSPAALQAATSGWAATTHATVAGADHFFRGSAADQVAELVAGWLRPT